MSADDVVLKPPLVLLTGFLGAGKTTILNRVLGAQHRRRVGVIINELGRIDIDTRLVKSRAGDVMELAGGCVCHEVRVQSELWAAIAEVARRARPEVVVLETTGIAEPWSILDGLEGLGDAAPAVASGVVCAVDAEAGAGAARAPRGGARPGRGGRSDAAHQARSRRRRSEVVALHRELGAPQPGRRARQLSADRRGDRGARSLAARRPPGAARARPAHGPHRHGQLAAVAYSDPAPLLAEPLLAVVERLGPALVRAKGFVHLAGEPRRGFLERAGLRTELRFAEPWGDAPPLTELVLIGEGLDAGAIRRQLWACRASVQPA